MRENLTSALTRGLPTVFPSRLRSEYLGMYTDIWSQSENFGEGSMVSIVRIGDANDIEDPQGANDRVA